MLFAAACLLSGSGYFRYAGLVALLGSVFNLLPVLPLDGGRLGLLLLETAMDAPRAEWVMARLGTACALAVAITGAAIRSPAAAAVGIWLGILANRPDLR